MRKKEKEMRNKLSKVVLTGMLAVSLIATAPAAPAWATDSQTQETSTSSSEGQNQQSTNFDGTITITNAQEKYDVYQLLTVATENGDNITYTVSDAWKSFFTAGAYKDRFKVDGNKVTNTTQITNDEAQNFAKAALEYATKNSVAKTTTAAFDEKTKTATATGLTKGVYLINTTTGTLLTLTNDRAVEIKDKNDAPTTEKKVYEGENAGASNDAAIGDTVNFEATIEVKKGAKNYVYHDKMDEGLTFNKDSVAVSSEDDNTKFEAGKDYTVIYTDNSKQTDGCTFEVKFTGLDGSTEDKTIKLTYSATVNEKALISTPGKGQGNKNTEHVTYGDNGNTTESTTNTYVYSLKLHKFGSNAVDKYLAGAEFEIHKTDKKDDGAPIKFTVNGSTYTVAKEGTDGAVSTIKTVDNAPIDINGLDSGDYYFFETKAPEGYNGLENSIHVNITRNDAFDGKYTVKNGENAADNGEIKIENSTGSLLPTTGGIGTTIFKVVGGALVVIALLYFVIRRRKTA